jgi:hypothetical protein
MDVYQPTVASPMDIQPPRLLHGAHDRDRTGDLILTKDVLYLLSYVGVEAYKRTAGYALPYISLQVLIIQQALSRLFFGILRAGDGDRTRDQRLGRPRLYH